jgi:hypothetical protein
MRGGVVQKVYTDAGELRVIVVDWNAGDDLGDRCSGGDFVTQPVGKLPEDTMWAVFSLTS